MTQTITETFQKFESLPENTPTGKAVCAIKEDNSKALTEALRENPSIANVGTPARFTAAIFVNTIEIFLGNYADSIGSHNCSRLLATCFPNFNHWKMSRAHWAAAKGDIKSLEIIAKPDTDIDAENSLGLTALDFAIIENHPSCVEHLVQVGADLNRMDCFEETPLHRAARAGHTNCLTLLLKYGATATPTNKHQVTGQVTGVVNPAGLGGMTPLHLAAQNGHTECVRLLLLHGACTKTTEMKMDETPLRLSARLGNIACFNALLLGAPLLETTSYEKEAVLELLSPDRRAECSELVAKLAVIQRYAEKGEDPTLKAFCQAIGSPASIEGSQIEQLKELMAADLHEAFRFVCKNILKNPHQELSTEPTVDSKDRSGGTSAASVSAAEAPRVTAAFTPGAAFATGATRLAAAAPTTPTPPAAAEPTLPGIVAHAGRATAGRGR